MDRSEGGDLQGIVSSDWEWNGIDVLKERATGNIRTGSISEGTFCREVWRRISKNRNVRLMEIVIDPKMMSTGKSSRSRFTKKVQTSRNALTR